MSDIRVTIEELVPEFIKLIQSGATPAVFANTLATLNALTYAYQAQWKAFALGEQMPGTPKVIKSGAAYAQTIQVNITDEFIKEIFTDSPHHWLIEKDWAEVDLKPGLLSGTKVRYSKSGTPYNIVAFRAGAPKSLVNPMPLNVYQVAKAAFDQADRAKVQGTAGWAGRQKAGTSRVTGISPRRYEWGIRMGREFGGPPTTLKTTSMGIYAHKFSKYANMVRLQASTEGAKRAEYITFRCVSVRSDPRSWITPPHVGIPIRQAVVEKMREETVSLMREAILKDLGAST